MPLAEVIVNKVPDAGRPTAFVRSVVGTGGSRYLCIPKKLCIWLDLLPGDVMTIVQSGDRSFAVVKTANGPRHAQPLDDPVGVDRRS